MMVAEFQVQRLPIEPTDDLVCALCARRFAPSPTVEMVYAGGVPVGLVCSECIAHPEQAAAAARRRAQHIRTIARNSENLVSRQVWIRLLQIAHARADYWEDLASRIERMSPWEQKEHFAGSAEHG